MKKFFEIPVFLKKEKRRDSRFSKGVAGAPTAPKFFFLFHFTWCFTIFFLKRCLSNYLNFVDKKKLFKLSLRKKKKSTQIDDMQ